MDRRHGVDFGIRQQLLETAIGNLELIAEGQKSKQLATIAAGMRKGRIAQALPMFRQLADTYAGAPQLPAAMKIAAWLDYAVVALTDDRKEALAAGDKALALDPRHPGALAFLAQVHVEQRAFETAQPLLERLTALADEADNVSWKAFGFEELGIVHHAAGRLDAAAGCYAEALRRFRALKQEIRLAVTLGNFGLIHRRRRNFAEAEKLFAEALDIWQRHGAEPEAARILGYLASVHFSKGEFDDAVALFTSRAEINRRLEDKAELAADHANIGLAGIRKGDAALACKHLHAALDIYRTAGLAREAQAVADLIEQHDCRKADAA